jgi:hypothetical protein
MDGSGMYDGWTDHTIRAYASFVYGIRITVSGPDRNGIKDYLAELYQDALTRDIADMDYRDAAQKCYAND